MTIRRILPVLLACVAVALLAACTGNSNANNNSEQSPQVGAANPASEFCIKQGGKLEMRKDTEGNEYAMCILPDGQEVEEWEYFRKHNEADAEAENIGMANPASEFCIKQGGKLEPRKDKDGNEYAMCHLPDGQVVEEWEYFHKHNSPEASCCGA